MDTLKLADDEARRRAQHEQIKGKLGADVHQRIAQEAASSSPAERAEVESVAAGLKHRATAEVSETETELGRARRMTRVSQVVDYVFFVVYGLIGLKTHCKALQVVRREGDRIRRYTHLGTGNYNSVTTKQYTDLGYLTADDDIDTMGAKHNALLDYASKIEQRLAAIEGRGAEQEQEAQAAVQDRMRQDVDEFFAGLDAEVYDQFGSGTLAELDKASPESKARREVIKAARRIMDLHDDRGEQATTAQCLEEALMLLHREQFIKVASQPVREQVQRRKQGAVARPSGSAPLPRHDNEDPGAKARREMRETAAANGIDMRD